MGQDCNLWVEVKGMKGPLAETGVEKTKRFTSDVLASLKAGSAPEGRSASAVEQTDQPDSLRSQVVRQTLAVPQRRATG